MNPRGLDSIKNIESKGKFVGDKIDDTVLLSLMNLRKNFYQLRILNPREN